MDIQKLIDQSTLTKSRNSQEEREFLEKFAKQVAQECANIANNEGLSYRNGNHGREASDRIWFKIRNTFELT